MKLELKHIAPYHEHRVKLYDKMGVKYNISWVSTKKIAFIDTNGIGEVQKLSWGNANGKLIMALRPLSDLTKEIEHNGEKFVPIEWLLNEYGFMYLESETLPVKCWEYRVIQKLFEWHFDVFGLIGRGLAINKNEI